MKKLGFGLMRLPLHINEDDSSINYEITSEMVDKFIENGFTYFDTAYFYHSKNSGVAVKKTLSDRYKREEFILANKMPVSMIKDAGQYDEIFKDQLKTCGVEYFDYYLLHALNNITYEKSLELGGFNYLTNLKKQGLARNIGFSFHDTPEVLDKILTNQPEIQFVQLQVNYLDWENEKIKSKECYEVARKHNKDIIIIGPVKGGLLANLPKNTTKLYEDYSSSSASSWAIRYAGSLEGVFMVLSGMSTLEQMEDNISFMKDFKPINLEEKNIMKAAIKSINDHISIPCTDCKYCVENCPEKILIPKYFSLYNMSKQFLGSKRMKNDYLNLTKEHGKASNCIECGLCEEVCPQHLLIPKLLKDVALTFETE